MEKVELRKNKKKRWSIRQAGLVVTHIKGLMNGHDAQSGNFYPFTSSDAEGNRKIYYKRHHTPKSQCQIGFMKKFLVREINFLSASGGLNHFSSNKNVQDVT